MARAGIVKGGRMSGGEKTIGVIGLGYVGLPLAVEFGRLRPVVGYDIRADRIAALQTGQDDTLEVSPEELAAASHLRLSSAPDDLAACQIYIVTVPTPIDVYNRPDLTALRAASQVVGAVLSPGDIVIYESTVYPGATEEDCVPILEEASGLRLNQGFFVGYSPERINPGDKTHRLPDICKVVSGSTPEIAQEIDAMYRQIVRAGTHLAPSIRVAEAAKVIENTQRDVNIALINEMAVVFNRLGIDTADVLAAAGTKWNFLPFRPGLVGGHCIGVDPYYLAHKAEEIGYHPEIILAGRRLNNSMGAYVANRLVKAMLRGGGNLEGARVLVLGLAFKENCPDLRNTGVTHVLRELQEFGLRVDVHDPWVDAEEARRDLGLTLVDPVPGSYDAVLLAVPHKVFVDHGPDWLRSLGRGDAVIFDLKSVYEQADSDLRL